MKSDKRQTLVLVGISLLVIAGVLLYVALSQPKIYDDENNGAVTSQVTQELTSVAYESSSSVQTSSAPLVTSNTPVSYPINLNTATQQELCTINGIGEKRAAAIIQYREQIGGYTSVEQIKNIQGIGDSIYAKVSPYLTV